MIVIFMSKKKISVAVTELFSAADCFLQLRLIALTQCITKSKQNA